MRSASRSAASLAAPALAGRLFVFGFRFYGHIALCVHKIHCVRARFAFGRHSNLGLGRVLATGKTATKTLFLLSNVCAIPVVRKPSITQGQKTNNERCAARRERDEVPQRKVNEKVFFISMPTPPPPTLPERAETSDEFYRLSSPCARPFAAYGAAGGGKK